MLSSQKQFIKRLDCREIRSADLVESVLGEISDALMRDEMVKISSFGSFFVRQKGQRVGRNPKTGEEVPILPRRVLVFRPSHVLEKSLMMAIKIAFSARLKPRRLQHLHRHLVIKVLAALTSSYDQ